MARSTPPGRPPPTLRMTSCKARPIVALARLPWPRALMPEFIPRSRTTAPLTISTGPTKCVVASTPWMLNSSVQAASTAARITGMNSGRQPAMTALIATFSTVQSARSGGTTATTSFGCRLVPESILSTRSGVGGTTGRPSVQPRSKHASISSSRSPSSIRRDARRLAPKRAASLSAIPGSTVIEPQPARHSGSPSPRSAMPVSVRHSARTQPSTRFSSWPLVTLSSVGTTSMPSR